MEQYLVYIEDTETAIGPFPTKDTAAWWINECTVNGFDALDMTVIGPIANPHQTLMDWQSMAEVQYTDEQTARVESRPCNP